jgi:hypothetical protein
MHNVRLATGIILIFLVGAMAGSLATTMFIRHRMEGPGPGGPPPHARSAMLVKRLTDDLNLTGDQQQAIRTIAEESERQILGLRKKYLPEMKEIEDRTFALIREKLTAGQQKKLEDLQARLRDRHARAFLQAVEAAEPVDRRLARMRTLLDLSDNQVGRVRPLLEENEQKRLAVAAKYRQHAPPDMPLLTEEMREIDLLLEERLAKVLTAPQMARYMQEQGGPGRHGIHPPPPPGPPPPKVFD